MNRRGFIRSAAGVLIAAGAGQVLTPERTVWALDRTMIAPAPEELMRRHAVRESRLARAAWLRGDMEEAFRHTELANLIAHEMHILENAQKAAEYLK